MELTTTRCTVARALKINGKASRIHPSAKLVVIVNVAILPIRVVVHACKNHGATCRTTGSGTEGVRKQRSV